MKKTGSARSRNPRWMETDHSAAGQIATCPDCGMVFRTTIPGTVYCFDCREKHRKTAEKESLKKADLRGSDLTAAIADEYFRQALEGCNIRELWEDIPDRSDRATRLRELCGGGSRHRATRAILDTTVSVELMTAGLEFTICGDRFRLSWKQAVNWVNRMMREDKL